MTQEPLDYASPGTNDELRREKRERWAAQWKGVPQLVAIMTIVLLLFVVLAPLFDTHERGGPRVACMSQLRQIAVALQIYANANRGVYPQQLTDLCASNLSAKFFTCPASKTETPASDGATPQQTIANLLSGKHVSYVYLGGGQNMKSFKPNAVIAYEPANHGAGPKAWANVLFNDGHVTSVPAVVLSKMIAELAAGQNPPPAAAGH